MRKFTLQELEDLEVRWNYVYQQGMGARRWSETFLNVFECDGKFYEIYTEEGLTEMQQDGMDAYDHYPEMDWQTKTVDCPEVESYTETIVVTKWRKKNG